jgi:hypothetical protein
VPRSQDGVDSLDSSVFVGNEPSYLIYRGRLHTICCDPQPHPRPMNPRIVLTLVASLSLVGLGGCSWLRLTPRIVTTKETAATVKVSPADALRQVADKERVATCKIYSDPNAERQPIRSAVKGFSIEKGWIAAVTRFCPSAGAAPIVLSYFSVFEQSGNQLVYRGDLVMPAATPQAYALDPASIHRVNAVIQDKPYTMMIGLAEATKIQGVDLVLSDGQAMADRSLTEGMFAFVYPGDAVSQRELRAIGPAQGSTQAAVATINVQQLPAATLFKF